MHTYIAKCVVHHLKHSISTTEKKAFGDARFGQAAFADLFDVHLTHIAFYCKLLLKLTLHQWRNTPTNLINSSIIPLFERW